MHVGLREPVETDTVRGWLERQDADAMLGALHRVPVRAGDAILVPAGTLHAIGAGILLLELQEPTDLSVLLEYRRFGVEGGPEHLGLGWDTALASLDRSGAAGLVAGAELPPEADPYFRAQRLQPGTAAAELEPSFAVLVVVDGDGALRTERGDELGPSARHRGCWSRMPRAARPSRAPCTPSAACRPDRARRTAARRSPQPIAAQRRPRRRRRRARTGSAAGRDGWSAPTAGGAAAACRARGCSIVLVPSCSASTSWRGHQARKSALAPSSASTSAAKSGSPMRRACSARKRASVLRAVSCQVGAAGGRW